jgi:hypothetical protein
VAPVTLELASVGHGTLIRDRSLRAARRSLLVEAGIRQAKLEWQQSVEAV